MSYNVVNSLAQQIVDELEKSNLLSLVTFFNAGFPVFLRLFHGAFMLRMSYLLRMVIATVMYMAGLIGLAFCTEYKIVVAAFICIILIGSSCFLGERFAFFS